MSEEIFALKRVLYDGKEYFGILYIIEDYLTNDGVKIVIKHGDKEYKIAKICRPPKDVPLDVYKVIIPEMLKIAHTVVENIIEEEEYKEIEEYAIMIDEEYHYMKELGIIEDEDFDEEDDF